MKVYARSKQVIGAFIVDEALNPEVTHGY
ncbi:uncharacterized protein G2W53_034595 [Senna tora]|uniref:Uncharacterized protein n=1 Tax=Senna tora TaxID=362788 RepID=A0A834WDW5_9FABA|nr:uncharacterized protein G2W53_034595 [Senna tora]